MEVHLVQLNEDYILRLLTGTLSKNIDAIISGSEHAGLSRCSKNENLSQIFMDGISRAAGDPSCSLGCNEVKDHSNMFCSNFFFSAGDNICLVNTYLSFVFHIHLYFFCQFFALIMFSFHLDYYSSLNEVSSS